MEKSPVVVTIKTTHNQSMSLEEVLGHQIMLGCVYHAVIEEMDDDGKPVFSDDTVHVVNSKIKRPESVEFYKALRFTKAEMEKRLSEVPGIRFFGPIYFNVAVEEQ